MDHAYWGPAATPTRSPRRSTRDAPTSMPPAAGSSASATRPRSAGGRPQAIADGKVIGWFQGRLEWGPRALGNRSILGDPRRADMKEILNPRSSAASPSGRSRRRSCAMRCAEWFENDDDVPFMMQVFQIQPEKRPQIPAVTHVDGSGRLQTVTWAGNPRYAR